MTRHRWGPQDPRRGSTEGSGCSGQVAQEFIARQACCRLKERKERRKIGVGQSRAEHSTGDARRGAHACLLLQAIYCAG